MPPEKSLYRLLSDLYKKRRGYFSNYLDFATEIKKEAKAILGEARIFVFGSIITGAYGPDSDIDILIVSENIPKNIFEQTKIKQEILKDFEESPFEIHLITPKEFEGWYKNFIKNDYIEVR